MTVQRLINLAFLELGEISSGGAPNTDESTDALDIANQLLAQLGLDGLYTYNRKHYSGLTVTAGVNAYTIGSAGSWATTDRPLQIEGATAYSGHMRQGLQVVSMADFARMASSPKGVTQLLPELLGVDNATPTLNARIFPNSNIGCSVELHTIEPLTALASLVATVDFAAGYERPFRLLLAGELYPQFPRESGMDPQLAQNIQNAKVTLAQLNASMVAMPPAAGQQQ